MKPRLTHQTLSEGVVYLTGRDRQLKSVITRYGPPPLWDRKEGFATLIYIIIEQQVSIASAKAVYGRLLEKVSPLTPANFLSVSDDDLKSVGLSRQKVSYCRNLSRAIADGDLDPAALSGFDDDRVKKELTKVKGIGSWTADIYLLMALRRPDAWPAGDLALAQAVRKLKRYKTRPSPERLESISRTWRPWRAVAARILWHYYLSGGK
jgi:DNA-3-methyladenine glycosylase II